MMFLTRRFFVCVAIAFLFFVDSAGALKISVQRYTEQNCTAGSATKHTLNIRPGKCHELSDKGGPVRSWSYLLTREISAEDKDKQQHCQLEFHQDHKCRGAGVTIGRLSDYFGDCIDDNMSTLPSDVMLHCGVDDPKGAVVNPGKLAHKHPVIFKPPKWFDK